MLLLLSARCLRGGGRGGGGGGGKAMDIMEFVPNDRLLAFEAVRVGGRSGTGDPAFGPLGGSILAFEMGTFSCEFEGDSRNVLVVSR
jgi:hypothetical protein